MATMRDRIVKAFGGDTGQDLSAMIAATEAALENEGMVGQPFSPGSPLRPFNGYSGTPRSSDYQTGYNIAARPRLNQQVSFSSLRGLVDAYDIAQICIWHRIDSIRSLDWHLVPVKGMDGDASEAVKIGMAALRRPDREFPFKTWLAKYLFDILAFDAGTLYKMRNNAGQPIGLRVLDGTTIAPLVDYWGNRPTGDAPAFVQFAQGLPWEWLTDDDIVYEPFRPQTNSVYGKAPLETLLLNANTDLRFQQFFLNHFTEGNVPEGFAGAPEGWSPNQIQEYQETWDALLYGDESRKHQIRWVPHGTNFAWTNEAKFDDTFSLFLMRKTAASFHVTPADLGFTEDVNRASGETQADVQFRVGDLPLMEHVAGILSHFLQDDLHLPLEFQFDTGREVEDRVATAQANKIYAEMGAISVSEIREDVFGRDEPDGIPVPRFIFSTRAGPIPLSALLAVAGPVDPSSGAPEPGAPLPHKPFSLVEGVAPQHPPDSPPLAVVRYPEENAASVQAESVDSAAVLKDGGVAAAGVSVVGGTVAPASPLLAEDEDPDDELDKTPDPVAKAAEDRAFRAFVKARTRDRRWRDFTFHQTDTRDAQERNRAARVSVLKAEGVPTVAGLCVRAADTGRVLMLQRSLDPDDPSRGMWEFPGGHLENGETVLTGAVREWCEETGCVPPVDGTITNQWTSASGVYQGIVLTVDSETSIALNPDEPFVSNPDDPDGDVVETCAWWDPALLSGNPAIRAELADDITLVLEALSPSAEVEKAAASEWSTHPFRRIEGPLADYHAPLIGKAIRSLVTKEQIRSAVEAYLAKDKA